MLILTLKKIVQKIPYFPGVFLKYIPFSWKVGGEYLNQRNKLFKFNDSRNINYVLHNLNFIVNYALSNFEFYRNFYGVTSYSIKSIDDFQKLPILTKEDARILAKEVSNGYLKLNTGGSTGKPLSFYIDSNGLAREWSHLHFIWKDYGYNPRQLMLTALGARTNNLTVKFHAVNNEFLVNPNICEKNEYLELLKTILNHKIKYFQGYPSNIYKIMKDFKKFLDNDEFQSLISTIRVCFLSSEFTPNYMINFLKYDCNLNLLTWYGHSEMCVFASDKDLHNNYLPFYSYGYPESFDNCLLGTSYFNLDMPLIRYNTEDVISAEYDYNGLISNFKMIEGRVGDFVLDKNHTKISLTILIFGQHHEIFNVCEFVQAFQKKSGDLTFLISGFNNKHDFVPGKYFDLNGFNFNFDFILLKKPIKSNTGKLKLKLNKDDFTK